METPEIDRTYVTTLGIVLSLLFTLFGGISTWTALYIHEYGMTSPEMFGWAGSILFISVLLVIAISPTLLLIIICGFVWRTPLLKHALVCTVAPLISSSAIIFLSAGLPFKGPQNTLLASIFCFATIAIFEAVMKNSLQNNSVDHITGSR